MYQPITIEELSASDLEQPIIDADVLEVESFDDTFLAAAKIVESSDTTQAKVYRLLASICGFHFKPTDKLEPFDCQISYGDGRRSLIGSDFSASEIEAIAAQIGRVTSVALRTRMADLVWTRDKSKSGCARLAIFGYVTMCEQLNAGTAKLRFERDSRNSIAVQNYLKRAITIARSTGWWKPENDELRRLTQACLEIASGEGGMALVRFGSIAVEVGLDTAEVILNTLDESAEKLAAAKEFHAAEAVQKLSIRRARIARNDELIKDRSLRYAAILQSRADATESALLKAHALQEAYDALQNLRGVRTERKALHDKLREAQTHMYEEFGQFEHSMDLTDEVNQFRSYFDDLSLLDSLKVLAQIELPKQPNQLEADAKKAISDHPLSSLFSSTIVDGKGRTVAKVTGAGSNDDSEAIRYQIIKSEGIRMGLAVSAGINPARELITQRYAVNHELLFQLCLISPFVPSGSEHLFASGIRAFLYGDEPIATSMLVPALEAGLRAMIGAAGRSDTKLLEGGIEEVIGIGSMLANHRDALETVFGPALIFCIENLFVHDFGPKIRHTVCHGLARDGTFYSDEFVYANKLIFALVLLPLTTEEQWSAIKDQVRRIVDVPADFVGSWKAEIRDNVASSAGSSTDRNEPQSGTTARSRRPRRLR